MPQASRPSAIGIFYLFEGVVFVLFVQIVNGIAFVPAFDIVWLIMLQPDVRQALDEFEALPQVPENGDLDQLVRMGKVLDGRKAVVKQVCLQLDGILSELQRRSLAVFFDGLPGSGKSGVSKKVAEHVTGQKILSPEQILTVELDTFLGTESGTWERANLTRHGKAFFDEYYIRYGQARQTIIRALDAVSRGHDASIPLPRAYNRGLGGKFADDVLYVRRDVRLVMVEGTGAIDRIAGLDGFSDGISRYTVFVHARNKQSMLNAVLRDMIRKNGITFENRYLDRAGEYAFLTRQLARTPRNADHVCRRYPVDDSYLAKLSEKDRELAGIQASSGKSVRDILMAVHPDFWRRVAPDPKVLGAFPSRAAKAR